MSTSFSTIPPVISLEYIDSQTCSICLDPFSFEEDRLIVSHAGEPIGCLFHENCLLTWTQQNPCCPLDRRVITEINGQKTRLSRVERSNTPDDFFDEWAEQHLPRVVIDAINGYPSASMAVVMSFALSFPLGIALGIAIHSILGRLRRTAP